MLFRGRQAVKLIVIDLLKIITISNDTFEFNSLYIIINKR